MLRRWQQCAVMSFVLGTHSLLVLQMVRGMARLIRWCCDRCIVQELVTNGSCPVCRKMLLLRLHVEVE